MTYKGTLSIEEVAAFMGKSKLFVRRSIENGSLPIGAYTKEGKVGSYYISPKRAYEYMGYKRDEESTNDSTDDCKYCETCTCR